MRFIMVQPHMRAGGSEMQTLLLSNELAKRGHDVHLVLHSAVGEFLDEVDDRVRIVDLGAESHGALPVIAYRLARALRRFDNGFVIVKLWSSLLAIQPALAANPQLDVALCEDLDPELHWRQLKLGRIKRLPIRTIFRRSGIVYANTEAVADGMVRAYSLRSRPRVLYGGIDLDRIQSMAAAETGLRGSGSRLSAVTVASLRERKGHERVAAALRKLSEPWTWHIVGSGPHEPYLREQFADLEGEVVWHGAVANPYAVVRASDVMLHLAHSEAFGVAILEALALGVPVVSSATIGPSEIRDAAGLTHDGPLRIVDGDDANAVAAAFRDLAMSEETVDAVTDYDIRATADRWEREAQSARPTR